VAVDLISEPLQNSIFAPVVEACRRYDCYVATSTQEKIPQMPGTFFHTGFVMGPEGLVLRSPKSQAQSAPEVSYLKDIARDYERIFGPGSILPVKETPIPTRREKEVIRLIMGDRSTQQIAESLGLSISTVETHRKNILNKLGLHSAAGLVRYGLERGWAAI